MNLFIAALGDLGFAIIAISSSVLAALVPKKWSSAAFNWYVASIIILLISIFYEVHRVASPYMMEHDILDPYGQYDYQIWQNNLKVLGIFILVFIICCAVTVNKKTAGKNYNEDESMKSYYMSLSLTTSIVLGLNTHWIIIFIMIGLIIILYVITLLIAKIFKNKQKQER